MHPRLQEVQFLDSKGKPLPARQREVVAEAFSGWFEEKILPKLERTSGPIVGFLRGCGTHFVVQLIARGEIRDEWLEGAFEIGLEGGQPARNHVRTLFDEYRIRWLISRVHAGVQCLLKGDVGGVRCGICGGQVLVQSQDVGWKVDCAAGCFDGHFHLVAGDGREPAVEHAVMALSAEASDSNLQPPPFPWERYAALLRPRQLLPVRHGSRDEVLKWTWAQPVREFSRRGEFGDAQEDFQFLVSRALQAFVRSGLVSPFPAWRWKDQNRDSGFGALKAWWRRLLGSGSGIGFPGMAGPPPRAIHANHYEERRCWSEGLLPWTTLECMEFPDDRWIPALRDLATVVPALPILIDCSAMGDPEFEDFAVLLKADECWLGADDAPTRDHVTRLLRKAGIIEEAKG